MEQLFLIALSGFLSYLFNEFEDKSMKSGWTRFTQYLNTNKAWKNKWKLDSNGNLLPPEHKWYYFGIIPPHAERFIYSSTLFVFITDGEHLFQWLKFRMIDLAFFVIGWQFFVAFEVGKMLSSFVKEAFLKWLH